VLVLLLHFAQRASDVIGRHLPRQGRVHGLVTGFTVAEAATGAEATEAARTVRPGLVLLDIQLPDFDGFEVARRLAAAPGQDKAPVVVLTSTREARDYGRQIAASPAAGFLPKDQLSGKALRRFPARDQS
jgi:CheY-like chemotaxis protein